MAENDKKRRARGYFHNRSVVVTGASSGIGSDVAQVFGAQGAAVALLARRKSRLEELAEKIDKAGGRALAIECDVTRRAEVEAAVEKSREAFGKIDILVNSAGVLIPDPVEKAREEDMRRMVEVNLFGALHAMQAVLPAMRARRSGNIVNVASLAGRRGVSPIGGYSATKFALVGLTEALRTELFRSGVAVSLVMPGVIDTPMSSTMRGHESLRGIPSDLMAMPVRWVTWAVIAAVTLGLAEVDVPPGAATAEKLAALFPTLTDAAISIGTRLMRSAGQLIPARHVAHPGDSAGAQPPEETANGQAHRRAHQAHQAD